MGEIHYVKEHQEFMGAFIKRLHSEGFRYYLHEIGSANSVLIDYYIKGKINEIPELYLNIDKRKRQLQHIFTKLYL